MSLIEKIGRFRNHEQRKTWSPGETEEHLNQLQNSSVNMLQVLKTRNPDHFHYFPRLHPEPGWLKMAVAMYISQPPLNEKYFLGGHEAEILPLYMDYIKRLGFENSYIDLSAPEPGIDYSSPFHIFITPEEPQLDSKRTIEYGDWIDFSFFSNAKGRGRGSYRFIEINTTRDNGEVYQVEILTRGREKKVFDGLKLEPDQQKLVSDLLDARI